MVSFPLGLEDVNLLLAVTVIVLFTVLEFLSTQRAKKERISLKRLKNTACIFFLVFLVILSIRIVVIVLSP